MKNTDKFNDTDTFFTIKEASDFTGYSVSYLRKMTMRRDIPYYKVGGSRSVRFKKSELMEFLTQCRVPSNAELEAIAESKFSSRR